LEATDVATVDTKVMIDKPAEGEFLMADEQ
jgi:hypothetical protein